MGLKQKNGVNEQSPGGFFRAVFAALVVCCAAATNSSAVIMSTASVRTDMDAVEFLSQQKGQSTDKTMQDYIYSGNNHAKATSPAPAVYADKSAAPVPVAKFTAQPATLKLDITGRVPALSGTQEVPGLQVRFGPAPQAVKAAETVKTAQAAKTEKAAEPGKSAPEKASVLRNIGKWFSDAYSAVKSWVSSAKTWIHDQIMGKGRPLTAEEIAQLKPIYGDAVDYSKVQIVTGSGNMGLWGKILTCNDAAVTWGNHIYFPNDSSGKSEYSFGTNTYWLTHEMTHEYQYQKYGWGYVPQSAWGQLTQGQSFYDYQLQAGKGFRQYNVEQQADLVAHYYQILNGTRSATPEELVIYQQIMKGQGLFAGTETN